MKKILFIVAAVVLFGTLPIKAQLVYENNILTFNGSQFTRYTTTSWHGDSHAWIGSSGCAIKFGAMDGNGPYIGTNRDRISFADWDRPALRAFLDIYAKSYYTQSDIASKTNIMPVNNALRTVLALRPVTYNWKAGNTTFNRTSSFTANPKEVGFIAQELEQVLPDVVSTGANDTKFVNYQALIPVLTAAIQELNARIEELERQLAEK